MSNWAEGFIKVRGDKENVKRFLVNLVVATPDYKWNKKKTTRTKFQPDIEIVEDDWSMKMYAPKGFTVKDTERCFINDNIYWNFDNDIQIVYIKGFCQAWEVDVKHFTMLSKEYNIDIKIDAFESGDEFHQTVEIHKGNVIKNQKIKFNDYRWDCMHPELGG